MSNDITTTVPSTRNNHYSSNTSSNNDTDDTTHRIPVSSTLIPAAAAVAPVAAAAAETTTSPTSIHNNTIRTTWNVYRQQLGQIVNHTYFQSVIILLIAINSLMLGLATFDFVKTDATVLQAFETADQTFLIIFTIELLCQFVYLGYYLLRDPWLVFDLLLIVSSWVFQDVTIIRSFRIFRTLRLITRIKVMRNLVLALFSVVPRMMAIFLLLTLVSYIFAVMMTQLFKDLYTDMDSTGSVNGTNINYFGRIDASFLTLFQIMTLDGWADVANDVMMDYSWAWIPIIIYIIIAGFVVVNLVIAVICDAVSALKDEDKAKLHGSYHDTTTTIFLPPPPTTTTTTTTDAATTQTKRNVVIVDDKRDHSNTGTSNNQVQHHQQHAKRSSLSAPMSSTTTTTALQFLVVNEQLTKIEQQVQEIIQLQDTSIQHAISMIQQFQTKRMEMTSATTTMTTKSTATTNTSTMAASS